MKRLIRSVVALLAVAASAGCAYAPMVSTMAVRSSQLNALKPYPAAITEIPPLPAGCTRIFIYRPQAFVGMAGTAVIIVDGKWLGDAEHPFDNNLLLPGAVFVVDSPAEIARVWWFQGGKGEESDKALSLPSAEARTWYLRWGMKPTYGYLEITAEEKAVREIESLRFSGYVKLERP